MTWIRFTGAHGVHTYTFTVNPLSEQGLQLDAHAFRGKDSEKSPDLITISAQLTDCMANAAYLPADVSV